MATRRSHLILIGALIAAVVGAALLIIPGAPAHKKARLGLDLQGGLEVVLQAKPATNVKLQPTDLDRSVTIMRNRIDKLGVSEPEIRKQGTDQIVIELPGVKNPDQVAGTLGKTAQLELYDLETSVTGPSQADTQGNVPATPRLYDLLAGQQAKADAGQARQIYLFDTKHRLRAG